MSSPVTEEQVLARIEKARRRRPRLRDERITMAHGAGGKASQALVEGLIVPAFTATAGANAALAPLDDAALVADGDRRFAFTTDAFVVRPLAFPGGSIGDLAVNGTVNDLAVSGARPLALSVALILEEGLETATLDAVIGDLATAAERAGVLVATGDTKVVERGKADGLYVTTSGIGAVVPGVELGADRIRPGDRLLVSGTVGDHGTAVMLARDELGISADVVSDTCALWPVMEALMVACGPGLHCARDATRGGVATVACELALASETGIMIEEDAVPVRGPVGGAAELLGIDPLYIANEGKLVAFVAPDVADTALAAVRAVPEGAEAALIGEVTAEPPGRVIGRTGFGGHRMIDMLVGDPLPRIC